MTTFDPKSLFDNIPGNTLSGFGVPEVASAATDGPGFLGQFKDIGNLSELLKGFGALTGAYTGYKGLGLAEDQFDFSKEAFNKQFGLQEQAFLDNRNAQNAYTATQDFARNNPNATDAEKAAFLSSQNQSAGFQQITQPNDSRFGGISEFGTTPQGSGAQPNRGGAVTLNNRFPV